MEGGPSIQNNENLNSNSIEDEEKTAGCDIGCCDPRRPLHRMVALIFMCLLGFGKYLKQNPPVGIYWGFPVCHPSIFLKTHLYVMICETFFYLFTWKNCF